MFSACSADHLKIYRAELPRDKKCDDTANNFKTNLAEQLQVTDMKT
jgi:hypothetical protein